MLLGEVVRDVWGVEEVVCWEVDGAEVGLLLAMELDEGSTADDVVPAAVVDAAADGAREVGLDD